MKKVEDMTTAEMVAEYNKLTGKETKKFATRATGERQLNDARIAAALAVAKKTGVDVSEEELQAIAVQMVADEIVGITKDFVLVKEGEYTLAQALEEEQETLKLSGKMVEIPLKIQPLPELEEAKKVIKHSDDRGLAIAKTWCDARVAAKRTTRNAVMVEGFGEFKSTKAAFEEIGLPLNDHIKFRMKLKANKAADFDFGDKIYKFTIVEKGE